MLIRKWRQDYGGYDALAVGILVREPKYASYNGVERAKFSLAIRFIPIDGTGKQTQNDTSELKTEMIYCQIDNKPSRRGGYKILKNAKRGETVFIAGTMRAMTMQVGDDTIQKEIFFAEFLITQSLLADLVGDVEQYIPDISINKDKEYDF